jgi:hypothetical protein
MPPKSFKAPTKHGLEKKFKPWRRGQSSKLKAIPKSNVRSSLKNKLRSEKRRLLKTDLPEDVRKKVEDTIKTIEAEIAEKEKLTIERDRASKYHKVKFFERRKLMRLEKKIKAMEKKAAKTAAGVIKRSYAYIAEFPNAVKYISLFKDAARPKSEAGAACFESRMKLRKELSGCFGEEACFGPEKDEEAVKNDGRFGAGAMAGVALADALKDGELQDNAMEDGDSDSSDDESEPEPVKASADDSGSDSDSDSSSSSDDDNAAEAAVVPSQTPLDALLQRQADAPEPEDSDSDDDFLVEESKTTLTESLEAARKSEPKEISDGKGKKNEGWATQKGREGKVKRSR